MNTPERVVVAKDPDTGLYVVPEGSVYVGRGVFVKKGQPPVLSRHMLHNPHRGQNPCLVKECKRVVHTAEDANRAYRRHLVGKIGHVRNAVHLADKGLNFACRCPLHVPCHIDILLDVVAIYRWLHRDGKEPTRTTLWRAIDPELHAENVQLKRTKKREQSMLQKEAS